MSAAGATVPARATAPLALGAGAVLVTGALRLHDPRTTGSWGLCPVRLLTGLDCPMCGGLRAVADLTHLDLGAALASNLLLVVSLPLLVALWAGWLRRSTGRRWAAPGTPWAARRSTRVLLAAYAVLAVAFAVWRNTPAGHALRA